MYPRDGIDDEGAGDQARLRATVDGFHVTGFAVVDGSHFENLPATLKRAGVFARSLFLEQGDAEVEKAGPWLVKLGQHADTATRIFAIVGERPAAVYWSCASGEAILHRHLRSINMVRIPTWVKGGREGPSQDTRDESFERVFFRHFDPRALGALLPCLDETQLSRFLGPAQEVAFVSVDAGFKRLILDRSHTVAAGTLTITSPQVEAMTGRRTASLRRRTLQYLRDVAPEATQEIPDQHLQPFVEGCHRQGGRLGLTTQHAHFQWAYLNIMSNGRIGNERAATDFIAAGPGTPDGRVQLLVEQIVVRLRTLGEAKVH